MIDLSLTANDEMAMEIGVKRFSEAHPDERWDVTGNRGLVLIVTGSRITGFAEVPVARVMDMADSVFTALEQFREKL